MIIRSLFLFLFLFLNFSCSSLYSLKNNPSDKELFQYALKLKNQSYYQQALSEFYKLKTQFIYSAFIPKTDLAIANIYFKQKQWSKATRAYQKFSKLYPQHLKNDEALFYLAFSYFKQLPSKDRDLKLSKKTLHYFHQHLSRFPQSIYHKKSLKYKQKVLILLAQKQWLIASFHLKNNRAKSALPYMLQLLKNYSAVLPVKTTNKKSRFLNAQLPSLQSLKTEITQIKKL